MKHLKITAFVFAALTLAAAFFYIQAQFFERATTATTKTTNKPVTQSKTVIMYATSWCPYCQKAREYFAANNIHYTEYDIEKDEQALQRYKSLGGRGIPFILIDELRISGFDEKRLHAIYYDE